MSLGKSWSRRATDLPIEIFCIICQEVRGKADLLRLALVCQDWSSFALNELWRDMDDLKPLLKLVPHEVLVEQRGESKESTLAMDEGSSLNWTRLDQYRARILNLEYDLSIDKQRSAEYSAISDVGLGLVLAALITPSIRRLRLDLNPDYSYYHIDYIEETTDQDLGKTLATLPVTAPHLECLFLGTFLPQLSLDFLGRLRSLQHLDLSAILMGETGVMKADVFKCISSLTQLKRFDVVAWLETPDEVAGSWSAFPVLEELSVGDSYLLTIAEIVGRISSDRMRVFELFDPHNQVHKDGNEDDITDVEELNAVCRALIPFSSTLTKVDLDIEDFKDRGSPGGARILAAIRPLLELHQLEDIVLCPAFSSRKTQPPFIVKDEDTEPMALAWPRLKNLTLALNILRPGITFQTLVTFSARCPCLCHLDFSYLNALDLPLLSAIPETGHKLEALGITDLEIQNLQSFVIRLDRLFPHLKTEEMDTPHYQSLPQDVLQALGSVAGERRRAAWEDEMLDLLLRQDIFA
ncbi:hypothetical protein NEOLEDRAFT_1241701 [Neolentinus lepideus HHB14362 ss-1]|uniref:F-box domain-containing protein n=1 Tax=Neolentinus lepideus HHB14362 ss-1 TaxID=1314782 RepID=A0A165SQQ7_9AGAM|nr:hypothetical protein NEOLEDRAFT_1241701 [Neolentinus lepideus HHB14362 ss-1]